MTYQRKEIIGDATLYLGDALDIGEDLRADHFIFDPPYEAITHAAKNAQKGRKHRNDGVAELRGLDFDPIDAIRADVVALGRYCSGWYIAFCTPEGVGRWADAINASDMKYKRACVFVKPDSTPQLNGQGPAQGAENFVCAWAGDGFARWNAGGKRGVYTHCVNNPERWSPQQERAIAEVRAWLADPAGKQVFRLFGYAGTGKTTLARELAEAVKGDVLYATFTGKASLVLRKKGCESASTIHSLIYKVDVHPRTGITTFNLNPDSDLADAALLIVDEVSMVAEDLATDLLSFGTRILVLGDPAQLPPVKGEGFFINASPDVMLTEVHRQARDNPIIRMSMEIREGNRLQRGEYGGSLVIGRTDVDQDRMRELVLGADQLICGLNRTRTAFNRRIRALKGLRGASMPWHPTIGDRLICLRNNRTKHLFNGGLWNVDEVQDKMGRVDAVVTSLDEDRAAEKIEVFEEFFNGTEERLDWRERRKSDEFTFGWAITCHKSQGSQWDSVIVFDESGAFREAHTNWLYTAITRAAERVTVVV
jgi:exodeoxyribonuclease-5